MLKDPYGLYRDPSSRQTSSHQTPSSHGTPKSRIPSAHRRIEGAAAVMVEAQGAAFWVGGSGDTNIQVNTKLPGPPGLAHTIPPEVALRIAQHLNIWDLHNSVTVWRPMALASGASSETIKLQCARFSLRTPASHTWSVDKIRKVRVRMEQYNYGWSTLQYTSASASFQLPPTTPETAWAGSNEWRAGQHFMGESNGFMYTAHSWDTGSSPAFQGEVTVYRIPSLRNGNNALQQTTFRMNLAMHYLKAVAVDAVTKVVAALEFDNRANFGHPYFPILHLFNLENGHQMGSVKVSTNGFQSAEVYHMELHGDMVCIVFNDIETHSRIVRSTTIIQSWRGLSRYVKPQSPSTHMVYPYHTGFQFITEDLYIMTEKAALDPRDRVPSMILRVGHVKANKQLVINLTDKYAPAHRTVNHISLVRNVSPYYAMAGDFHSVPEDRLFGIKFDYFGYGTAMDSNVCLFGRSTVERWLGIPTSGPIERPYWVTLPKLSSMDFHYQHYQDTTLDPTNREGLSIIGRRLFWSNRWSNGWGLSIFDFNLGAQVAMQQPAVHGQMWTSYIGNYNADPYLITYTTTSRIANVERIMPNEDGLILKHSFPGADRTKPNFVALSM